LKGLKGVGVEGVEGCLQALDILDGALNDLLDIYKRLLPTWGDYLTLLGEVDLARLGDVFPEIGRVIEDNLIAQMEEEDDDGPLDVQVVSDVR